jgi:predicted dehydrogenase
LNLLNAAVVGLGNIGQGYDYDSDDNDRVLTHAKAFSLHPRFNLIAGVDPDPMNRERFTRKYGAPAFSDVESMQSSCHADVVSLCTPTSTHHVEFRKLIADKPAAIICEKPIATSVNEARQMLHLASRQGCPLLVNYMRRFEPATRALAKAVSAGKFGDIYKGTVWYSKGLLNNGSHFIDLLCFMLGNDCKIEYVKAGRTWNGIDPEPDCCLKFGEALVYLLAAREECFSLYSIELVGTEGVASYLEGGEKIIARLKSPDPMYPGEIRLRSDEMFFESKMHRYQWHVLEGLVSHLDHALPLASDGHTALRTLEIVNAISSRLTNSENDSP